MCTDPQCCNVCRLSLPHLLSLSPLSVQLGSTPVCLSTSSSLIGVPLSHLRRSFLLILASCKSYKFALPVQSSINTPSSSPGRLARSGNSFYRVFIFINLGNLSVDYRNYYFPSLLDGSEGLLQVRIALWKIAYIYCDSTLNHTIPANYLSMLSPLHTCLHCLTFIHYFYIHQ